MTLDPDVILDRRRLKRKLGFWRIVAFLGIAAALIGGIAWSGGFRDYASHSLPHVARITVSGFIRPDRHLIETFEKVGKSSAVKGVIVSINSPGGATSGGEALYEAVRKLAEKKPTVAYVDSLAASAAYMTALGADQIVARRTALTGSIGVLVQWGDVTGLMDKVGVKLEEVKSTPLKAEPNPFKPASPEAKAMLDSMVQDTYRWFVSLVVERRGIEPEQAKALADGRVVTGAQAKDLKLVDQIGGQDVAQRWLETAKGVPQDLPVRDWKPRSDGLGFGIAESLSAAVTRGAMEALGFDGVAAEVLALDGLKSVWHPANSENTKEFGGIGQ